MKQLRREQALLSEARAARIVNLSTRTLQKWRSLGVGPSYVRLRGAVRYRLSDLKAFIDRGLRLTEGERNE